MKKVILYGASQLGEKAYHDLKSKYKILYYCDTDNRKWGKRLNNIEIIPPEKLKDLKGYSIIITSSYYQEISKILIGMGRNNYSIYEPEYNKYLRSCDKVKLNIYNMIKLNILQCFVNSNYIYKILYKEKCIKLYLPDINDYIQQKIITSCIFYEIELLRFIEQLNLKGSVFIDVGANIGNHTLFFSIICGASKVYSFEPNKQVFNILKVNIILNNLNKKVNIYNYALGSIRGLGKVNLIDSNNLGTGKVDIDINGTVKIDTLDNILKIKERVGLIKVDVEGIELDVLKGAINTIQRNEPIICIEVWSQEHLKAITEILGPNYKVITSFFQTYIFIPNS